MKTSKKIALGCFIAGFVFVILVLLLPEGLIFKALAAFAGLSMGFLCYDLNDVKEKIPVAWMASKRRYERASGIVGRIVDWFRIPHPFAYLFLVYWIIGAGLTFNLFVYQGHNPPQSMGSLIGDLFMDGLISFLAGILVSMITGIIFTKWAHEGAKIKKCFWSSDDEFFDINFRPDEKENMLEEGFLELPVSYKLIYSLIWAGFYASVSELLSKTKEMFCNACKAVWKAICATVWFVFWGWISLLIGFSVKLYKLIHSGERALCAVDGIIGGLIVLVVLHYNPVENISGLQIALTGICGGLCGALFGLFDYYKIYPAVSRRFFVVE